MPRRTTTGPEDGYGTEPKTIADVMLLASARIQAALPPGWSIRTVTGAADRERRPDGAREADAWLSLTCRDEPVVTYQLKPSVS